MEKGTGDLLRWKQLKTHSIQLQKQNYSYIDEGNHNNNKGVIVMVHGFPDLPYGYRKQLDYFRKAGWRVIIPYMLGYGMTDHPKDLEDYSMKNIATDLILLLDHLKIQEKVVFLGHDWGGVVVYRIALWYPDRVRAIAVICTPYMPPNKQYFSISEVAKIQPSLRYQVFFGTDKAIDTLNATATPFLNGIHRTFDDQADWNQSPQKLLSMSATKLLSPSELSYYVDTYMQNGGFEGPLSWYKTREVNYKDELALLDKLPPNRHIEVPVFFLAANDDVALPPSMSKKMGEFIPNLTKDIQYNASHWILSECANDVNRRLDEWLNSKVLDNNKETRNKPAKL